MHIILADQMGGGGHTDRELEEGGGHADREGEGGRLRRCLANLTKTCTKASHQGLHPGAYRQKQEAFHLVTQEA